MKFTIKNNNLYYYNYPIINTQLSPYLFLIYLYFLFYNIKFITNFNYLSIFVGVFGIIDCILHILKYNLYFIFILNIFFHLPFFYPLIKFKKFMNPNIINYILSALGILILIFFPKWPYLIKRKKAIALLVLVNIFFTYYYYFHYKH